MGADSGGEGFGTDLPYWDVLGIEPLGETDGKAEAERSGLAVDHDRAYAYSAEVVRGL